MNIGSYCEKGVFALENTFYSFTHLFKVDNDKKDTVYKNTNKIAWG